MLASLSRRERFQVASLVRYQPVYGDMVVVISGPTESNWPVEIKKVDLVKTMKWYKGSDVYWEKMFQETENSWVMIKWDESASWFYFNQNVGLPYE